MAPDDPDLLPRVPPPRPDRREAAIEAALRRFDGAPAAEAKPATHGSASWTRHPHVGMALAASLVIVVGIPAALIALRDRGPAPAQVSAPPPAARRAPAASSEPPAVASVTVDQSVAADAPPLGPVAPPAKPQPETKAAEAAPPVETPAAAPPPAFAAPPPPPSPPPPSPPPAAAPMMAQKSAEGVATSDVVVTGSRIRTPVEERANALSVADRAARSEAATAPDWILEDRSYAVFLEQLQDAVRAGNRAAVARLVDIPLRVNFDSGARMYRDRRSIQADYERIFTPRVRQAILGQRFERLFGRDQGLMIGNGAVWFDHSCPNAKCSPPGPVRITAINP